MKRNLTILEITLKIATETGKSEALASHFRILSLLLLCLSFLIVLDYLDANSYLVIAIFLTCKFFSLRQGETRFACAQFSRLPSFF